MLPSAPLSPRLKSASFARLALLASTALPAPGFSQEPPPDSKYVPPKYQLSRWREDWSGLLKHPEAKASQPWLAYKAIPLDSTGDWWVSLGASAFERFESIDGYRFGSSQNGINQDSYWLTRFFAHADWHLGSHWRVFTEVKSSWSTDRSLPGGDRPVDLDSLEAHNFWLEGKTELGAGWTGSLRAGRQELAFGRERLISILDWPAGRRIFDGFSGNFSHGPWNISSFWVRPQVLDRYEFNEPNYSQTFYGVYATYAKQPWVVDLYALFTDRNNRTIQGFTGNEHRQTYGLRLEHPLTDALKLELEGSVQVGSLGAADINAWQTGSELSYTFKETPWTPVVLVGLEAASGDSNPNDQEIGTFDTLYPLGHAWLGFVDAVGRRNILGPHVGLRLKPTDRLGFRLDFHHFERLEKEDAFYDVADNPIASSASASRVLGNELDLVLSYQLNRFAKFDLGWGHFFAGSFVKETTQGEDWNLLYAWLYLNF